MHRHKWKAIKLDFYNKILPYITGSVALGYAQNINELTKTFGGTELTLMCRKCGKTKVVEYPDQKLDEEHFQGTPYEIKTNYSCTALMSDTLCALGDIQDEETHDLRYKVLVDNLKNPSSIVREGAILGLSRLKDTNALYWLREALEVEPYEFMQRYFKQVIEILEEKECTQNTTN